MKIDLYDDADGSRKTLGCFLVLTLFRIHFLCIIYINVTVSIWPRNGTHALWLFYMREGDFVSLRITHKHAHTHTQYRAHITHREGLKIATKITSVSVRQCFHVFENMVSEGNANEYTRIQHHRLHKIYKDVHKCIMENCYVYSVHTQRIHIHTHIRNGHQI